jgi:hypothetical protein
MEFSARAALRFGWETFKRRPWFFVGATFLIMLASGLVDGVTSGIDAAITGSAKNTSAPGTLINLALGTLINMGATAFYLAANDNPDTVDLSVLWHPRPFWKFLGASILLVLAVAIGLVLLIVPGIIFMLMFMFTTFIVIERELGPIEAMKESRRITRGHKWQLLGFLLVLVLINLLGLLALIVGMLVSIPYHRSPSPMPIASWAGKRKRARPMQRSLFEANAQRRLSENRRPANPQGPADGSRSWRPPRRYAGCDR